MSDRTFKVGKPVVKGRDVEAWQETIRDEFKRRNIVCPIKIDGIYGVSTRDYTRCLLKAFGVEKPSQAMAKGITPALRKKVRGHKYTALEKKRAGSTAIRNYRKKLRTKWKPKKVHAPVARILQDDWGFHPPIHDGLDVITNANAPLFAMVKCKVIDVRKDGWWGKGAPANPTLRAKGDGIVQVEVLENVGPFKKGYHIGYGHCEKANVKVGQIIEAGHLIAHAGFANAWHIHLMYNTGKTSSGIGNLDPRPILDYAVKHG